MPPSSHQPFFPRSITILSSSMTTTISLARYILPLLRVHSLASHHSLNELWIYFISFSGLFPLSISHPSFGFVLFPYSSSNSLFRVNRSFKSRAFISSQPNVLSLFRVNSPSFLRVKFDTIRALVTLCTYSNLNISSASLRKDNIKYEACHLPRLVFHR
jgi:hypothetical protein